MNQAEQSTRIMAAEVRNEMNARAIYNLQQQVMLLEQATKLVQIGNQVFNPAQIALIYLGSKSIIINFVVQDGDQPLDTIFRGDDRRDFLAWLNGHTAIPPINQECIDCPTKERCRHV